MNLADYKEAFRNAASVLLFEEPMVNHTTWRIGGPADLLAIPESIEQIMSLISLAREHGIPYFVLGRGSNLLVGDGGVRGLLIQLGDAFSRLDIIGRELQALAGRSLVSAAHVAIKHGLSGLEFAALIPGTVGGAVVMNAGAHGSEMKNVVSSVQLLTPAGQVVDRSVEELEFGYRHSVLRDSGEIVLSVRFMLAPGDVEEMLAKVKEWSWRRQSTQPLSYPSCGSVFRNPPGDYAARLIEAAGLKGMRIGDAMISDQHANFIVNLGHARASDVMALIQMAQDRVKEQFGVELILEVRKIGEDTAWG